MARLPSLMDEPQRAVSPVLNQYADLSDKDLEAFIDTNSQFVESLERQVACLYNQDRRKDASGTTVESMEEQIKELNKRINGARAEINRRQCARDEALAVLLSTGTIHFEEESRDALIGAGPIGGGGYEADLDHMGDGSTTTSSRARGGRDSHHQRRGKKV